MLHDFIKTGVDTGVTATVLTSSNDLQIENPKALLIALATSVLVQLSIKGLKWVQKKLSKKN